jgi:hypothetical protein
VLHARTLAALRDAAKAGVSVVRAGSAPQWQQAETGLQPAEFDWCPAGEPAQVVDRLPRLVSLTDGTDIRCTAWRRGETTTRLLVNLRDQATTVAIDGRETELAPGRVHVDASP